MKNIFFLALIMLGISCNKADLNLELKSEVFQCCNIWDSFLTADITHEEAVTDFLDNNNITFSDLQMIDNGNISLCGTCCQCLAGMEVRFKINEKDLAALLDLGFEEN